MDSRVKKLKAKEKIEKKKERKTFYKKFLIFLIIIFVITILYSFLVEPKLFLIHEKSIQSSKISDNMHGLKIVEFSDLHYGTSINKNNIKKITKNINMLKPDIVIFAGDLIDDTYTPTTEDIKLITEQLSNINASLGKYAIYGNHDYDIDPFQNIMYDSDFQLLKNSYDLIYKDNTNPILLYGVDDVLEGTPNLEEYNKLKDQNIYKIILVHEPDYIEEIDTEKTDIVLSAHSHNKQVNLPLIGNLYLPKGAKKYYKNHYKVNNTDLYISNGIGCSKIGVRLFSIPSINFFRLLKIQG